MTPSGIKPATFRFVAQCHNHLGHRLPLLKTANSIKQVVFYDRYTPVHHATRHNTPIHNILSTAPQLNISQKALG
jgi:hypothetical protein